MRKTKRNNRVSRLYVLALVAAFATSMGASYFLLKGKFVFDTSFITEIASRQAKTAAKTRGPEAPRLYESAGRNDAESARTASLAATEDIIKKYLKPYGVRLLDLYVDRDGVVYIDLGDELKKNFRGDASEELGLIAGLYRSVGPAIPGFTALKILMEGHEADTLGGHIDISKPIGKEIAEDI
ncbi:MAG: hypothetical protein C4560_00755 [Nitrospiraceae bacterium]|nr:MAG: hypothetical protein C4560_00755 [Nitrospiraceae bacterium]